MDSQARDMKSSSSGSLLDDSVWSQLPEDMTRIILARLPLPNLLQVRTVCKKWEATIRSPPFLKLCSDLPSRAPWYLGFHGFRHEQGWAFDPSSSRWYTLDFTFLPPGRCAAAAGGLLCFCQDSVQANSLYVCNPITKVWRALPRFPGSIKQVAMRVDKAEDTYLVIAFVQDDVKCGALLYRKGDDSWREAAAMASHPQLLNIVDAAFCGGVLYCLNKCVTREWQYIQCYHFEQDEWSDLGIPMPSAFRGQDLVQMPYLVDHGGKLLLVEKIISSFADNSTTLAAAAAPSLVDKALKPAIKASVGIHELDLGAREWKNVAGTLEHTTLFVGSFTSRAVYCTGSQKLVYFTNHGSVVSVYDAIQDSWHRLPEFPRQRMMSNWIFGKPKRNLGVVIPLKGLWFDPRLDSTV
ncbi:F-box/kelch-repeat protein At5g15710-like [Selaginella moellendorffii]|uniref:F-box/kelch-repeat protein At5g15710-like n=1 Tax=Selaginella moellendorffii TaxID=88036 RepID=UPI000D1C4727|nr:F-box/kelch-repeat protein At5g15710-like [Selaginella moellendorffii]XP_024516699.1 F-box/kelch-repeat protein At5g15710-like [Selaginella moellendorffii]XP_024516700.1 F-box/kelch-repeat protein At5g15710-like [Selaginella moellendorffii]XP_024516701.1 F-box/kelch-repeat protein At5g15710-like [Selaginella moellendorffii]XP_024516702.1 F-box/kelch-repeat protein At5g15710-like [Selaginella moellendorffii]XP_024516703.1 F-box/kelch-repeat protein At5g15710-like [Selaginella moellendorffii]|eukprot:XP_024516698.1 F-box/kelch-repeat protein At5g15710-like [Selaginella moellendorffii]